jgi:L-lactate dehydrogenase complex protein LldG
MKESTHREQILTKVRNALIEKTENAYSDIDLSSDVMHKLDDEEGLEVIFASELIALGGNFLYCENEKAFLDDLKALMSEKNWPSLWCVSKRLNSFLEAGHVPLQTDVTSIENSPVVGITTCEKLIARTGSVVVSENNSGTRSAFAFPDIHLVLAFTSQVVPTLKVALQELKVKYAEGLPSQITVITGASRTADIEKTLVMGAHGPKEIYVFLVDDL